MASLSCPPTPRSDPVLLTGAFGDERTPPTCAASLLATGNSLHSAAFSLLVVGLSSLAHQSRGVNQVSKKKARVAWPIFPSKIVAPIWDGVAQHWPVFCLLSHWVSSTGYWINPLIGFVEFIEPQRYSKVNITNLGILCKFLCWVLSNKTYYRNWVLLCLTSLTAVYACTGLQFSFMLKIIA